MCCVSPSPCPSTTSSQLGQIISPEPANPYAGDYPIEPPPISHAAEEDDGKPAKRARTAGGNGSSEEDDGRDRISDLPDSILLAILAHLPLHDAGRTAALSSRWRRLFAESLLDFDASQPWPPALCHDSRWLLGAVTAILAAHPVPIRSFRVVMFGPGFAGSEPVVDGWFRTLAQRGVQELNVFMLYANSRQALPASLLNFTSLKTLKASKCIFPNAAAANAAPPQLASLKMLDLSDADLSEDALHAMLSHCPSLQSIKLKNIKGIKRICLRSPSLKSLLGDFHDLDELLVEDAPKLQHLVGIHMPNGKAKLKIVHAPKLEVLGYLGTSIRPLELCDTVFNGGIVQLRALMYSVKTLAIQVPFSVKGHATVVTHWLRCFPCLEVLSVEADERSVHRTSVGVEEWDMTSSIECLDHRLETVVLENYGGQGCQWGFLIFLLAMARGLKIVEFYCLRGCDEDWVRNQRALLCAQKRASPDAQFLFFRRSVPVKTLYLCHCCEQQCQEEMCRSNREFVI